MNRLSKSFEHEHTRCRTLIGSKVRQYFGNIQKKECEISLKINGVGLPLHKSAFLCNRKTKRLLFKFVLLTRAIVGVVFSVFSLYSFLYMGGAGGR